MVDENFDMGAGETAVDYTCEFLDAAVAKLDSTFGKGYAKANPVLVSGFLQASASNLNAFMSAATAMQGDAMSELVAAAMEEVEDEGQLDLLGKGLKGGS